MKAVLTLLIAVILVAGGWYLWNTTSSPMPVTEDDESEVTAATSSPTDDGTVTDGVADLSGDAEDNAVAIDVVGTNYEFDIREIRVDAGDTVTINFSSEEGFHDLVLDEFDVATERVNAGGSTSVTFVADEAGTYEYYCSVGNHREMGMVGMLIVE